MTAHKGRGIPTGVSEFIEVAATRSMTYDLVGAGLKSKFFNYDGFVGEIYSHLFKADRVVVDVSGLTQAQAASVQSFVNGLTREQAARVFILR